MIRNRWQYGTTVDLRRPEPPSRPVRLNTEPSAITMDTSRTALIAVDLQNDFCTRGGWLDSIGVDVSVLAPAIEFTKHATAAARSAGIPVVWLNWGNRSDKANIPPGVEHIYDPTGAGCGIGSVLEQKESAVLTKGSWGAAGVLDEEPGDIHVDKYRISGFWDTELDSVLRNLRVDTLVFSGVNSDQCVFATLIDAACAGYDVVLLTDASATTSPDYCHRATIYNTRQCYGFTATTEQFVEAIS